MKRQRRLGSGYLRLVTIFQGLVPSFAETKLQLSMYPSHIIFLATDKGESNRCSSLSSSSSPFSSKHLLTTQYVLDSGQCYLLDLPEMGYYYQILFCRWGGWSGRRLTTCSRLGSYSLVEPGFKPSSHTPWAYALNHHTIPTICLKEKLHEQKPLLLFNSRGY